MSSSRRTFLKVGVVSLCVLLTARTIDREVFAVTETRGSPDLKKLSNSDATCIAALAGAILKGALPEDAVARLTAINDVVQAFDRTVAGLPPAVQKEVDALLSLLTFSFTRRFVAGLSTPWDKASVTDVTHTLQSWRTSRFALLQQGYQALVRLIVACWYGNPLSWEGIGYDGPPFRSALGSL